MGLQIRNLSKQLYAPKDNSEPSLLAMMGKRGQGVFLPHHLVD